jgi:hypothetical protein
MNGWLTSSADREARVDATNVFLKQDSKLPQLVVSSGVELIGFVDECDARQSASFFHSFIQFLQRINESSFYFLWLPDGYVSSASRDSYPIYLCSSIHEIEATDFARLQSGHDERAFESTAWLVTSDSKRWAIYGEHYGSEIALLLCRDGFVAEAMVTSFPESIADPLAALSAFGDPSATEDGCLFELEFLRNYSK